MKIPYLALVLFLPIFPHTTSFSLTHLNEPIPGTEILYNRNGLSNTKDVAAVLTSPAALLKQSQHRQRNGVKDYLELAKNKAIENRIKENRKRFQSKLSKIEDYVVGGTLLAFGTFALLGNSVSLTIFYYQHKKLSPVEILFVYQACLDVVLTVLSYPLPILASFNHGWFRELGCTAYAIVCHFLRLASVFSVTSIVIFRFVKTCLSSDGCQLTSWTSFNVMSWGFTTSFLFALAPLFGFGKYDVEQFGLDCAVNWMDNDGAGRIYLVLIIVFVVYFPLNTIFVCYYYIITEMEQSYTQMQQIAVRKPNLQKSCVKLICIGAMVAAGFLMTWIPTIHAFLMYTFPGDFVLPLGAHSMLVLLSKLSPAWNPFLYVFCTKRYGKALHGLLQKWMCYSAGDREERNNAIFERCVNYDAGLSSNCEMHEEVATGT